MGPGLLPIALGFFLLPIVFVYLARKSFRRDPKPQDAWRSSGFSRALVGSSINSALTVIVFLVHNAVLPAITSTGRSEFLSYSMLLAERVIEWSGALFSVVFFVLAFAEIGKARIYVGLASLFTFRLWLGTL